MGQQFQDAVKRLPDDIPGPIRNILNEYDQAGSDRAVQLEKLRQVLSYAWPIVRAVEGNRQLAALDHLARELQVAESLRTNGVGEAVLTDRSFALLPPVGAIHGDDSARLAMGIVYSYAYLHADREERARRLAALRGLVKDLGPYDFRKVIERNTPGPLGAAAQAYVATGTAATGTSLRTQSMLDALGFYDLARAKMRDVVRAIELYSDPSYQFPAPGAMPDPSQMTAEHLAYLMRQADIAREKTVGTSKATTQIGKEVRKEDQDAITRIRAARRDVSRGMKNAVIEMQVEAKKVLKNRVPPYPYAFSPPFLDKYRDELIFQIRSATDPAVQSRREEVVGRMGAHYGLRQWTQDAERITDDLPLAQQPDNVPGIPEVMDRRINR